MTTETLREQIFVSPDILDSEETFSLPGTGFNVKLQIDKLKDNLEKEPDKQEAVENWLEQTKEDIWGFWLEYLAREPLLPINIRLGNFEGEERIIAPKYASQPWIETITNQERNGAVKESAEKIEQFLISAPPESIAILTSPPGWSGLNDEGGNSIYYSDTQTYIFSLDKDRELTAVTATTNLTLTENEFFLVNSGNYINNESQNIRERIEEVVRKPVLLEATNSYGFNIEGVIRTIAAINPEAADFEKIFHSLGNLEKLSQINDEVSMVVQNFQEELWSNVDDENFSNFAGNLLGQTVLQISRLSRTVQKSYSSQTIHYPIAPMTKYEYRQELRHLQTLDGCNGGGQTTVINTSLGPRSVVVEKSGEFVKNCGNCGAEIGEIICAGYRCPKCGGTYEGC